jgi:hypothetical protein
MVKCPFCQFPNEDGVLFCEQCKSDLGESAEPVRTAAAANDVAVGGGAGATGTPFEREESPFAFLETLDPAPPVANPIEEEVKRSRAPTVPVVVPSDANPSLPPFATPVGDVSSPAPAVAEPIPTLKPVAEAASAAAPSPVANAQMSVPTPTASPAGSLPPGTQPKLVVLRGLKLHVEFPLYEGHNFIGRADEQPVDIDLEDQEPPDRIWSSRQHAVITYEDGKLIIEDLNSSNGTFVNRTRVHPGQKRPLKVNDVLQIGTVQMKIKI